MSDKPTVLVIDDEPVIIAAATRILTAADFTVVSAENAEDGLALLCSSSMPVVLCDLILTGMSGFKFLQAAREHDPHVAVIVTTGYTTADHAIASLKQGAFDYLPKPFTANELLSPVRRATRAIGIRAGKNREPRQVRHTDRYYLGLNAWVRFDEDGSALLGMSELLVATVDPIVQITFPQTNAELHQGDTLVRFTTADGMTHRAWTALSGRVIESNDRVMQNPDFPRQDPLSDGWLVRIQPTHREQEVARLRD
jgi:FixJ family two-component response regulator/glycine cleavage system H lipoate-binding protein